MKKLFSLASKKIIIYGVVAVVAAGAAGLLILRSGGSAEEVLVVHPNDFVQEVSVSGKVVAAENLDLSFEQTGRVTGVGVSVGDKVSAGQILASQDTAGLNAQLAQMQAGIDVEKAKLGQLLAGASPEDITLSETAVANARRTLADAIQDAYTKSDDAVRGKADELFTNPKSANPKLNSFLLDSGFAGDVEWKRLLVESTLTTWAGSLGTLSGESDLVSAASTADKNLVQVKAFLETLALGINALTPNVNVTQTAIDKWKSDISTARTNINTAASAMTDAEEKLKTGEADLMLKKAPARSPDIALYQAEIRQAEASAQNIVAELGKKQVRAPINGVITVVNAKTGSIAAANETAVSLMSRDTLQIESYVPEKSIPFVKVGDQAEFTLDAYGSDVVFGARVISVDPAETIRDGVSTYRVKLEASDRDDRIKSGMTASIIITTEKKPHVIAVPQGIVIDQDGKKFVKVKEGGAITLREITIGSVSSLGQIEVVSGLKDGDSVILEQAKK